ncbi:MAG: glycosyltransferase, partial [Acidobacteria bacterium]|nr:glycosyltransferase [Acidobacteriota bacterium]
WVHDLVPLYHATRLVVAPLRYGAGIKGKLGESAVHGVPFVCTSIATEGTLMEHGRDCLNADTAEEFAREVIRLYSDAELWESLSRNVQTAIERQCAPAVAAARFEELFRLLNVW